MQTLNTLSIGFIGCGVMGGSIAQALALHAKHPTAQIVLYDKLTDRRDALATTLNAAVAHSETDLAARCEAIVLACKPHDIATALGRITWPTDRRTLISIAAGVTTETLRDLVPPSVATARVMPNLAASIGAGVTGVLRHHDPKTHTLITALFKPCGEVVILDREQDFAALTALSGSGPAFLFVALEALADGGVLMGLTRQTAQTLALHTMRGVAALALSEDTHTAALKDRVASPGGTTIHGLAALERAGMRSALIQAVAAAARRSDTLG